MCTYTRIRPELAVEFIRALIRDTYFCIRLLVCQLGQLDAEAMSLEPWSDVRAAWHRTASSSEPSRSVHGFWCTILREWNTIAYHRLIHATQLVSTKLRSMCQGSHKKKY